MSCEKCDYKGFSTNDVKTHKINKHSDLKPFQCTLCPRSFKRSTFLTHHRRESHASKSKVDKDVPCETCGKMFHTKVGAARCARYHKTQGRYECPFEGCEKIFNQKSLSRSHVKMVHNQTKDTLPCHMCEKGFRDRSNLNRHIFMVHTLTEKVVQCPICPTKSKTEKLLKRHLLTHENKKFPCPFEGCSVV